MTSPSPMRNDSLEPHDVARPIPLSDRILRLAKFLLLFGGLVLVFGGWSVGSQTITNQSIAISRGLTACGLLLAGGLAFVAAAIMYHRDGAFTDTQAIRNHR